MVHVSFPSTDPSVWNLYKSYVLIDLGLENHLDKSKLSFSHLPLPKVIQGLPSGEYCHGVQGHLLRFCIQVSFYRATTRPLILRLIGDEPYHVSLFSFELEWIDYTDRVACRS